jgi:hypothetical protein
MGFCRQQAAEAPAINVTHLFLGDDVNNKRITGK